MLRVSKVEGVEEVVRALEQWSEQVIRELQSEIDSCGEHLLSRAQALAPKLTGELEASGTKDPVSVDPASQAISVEVGFNKDYAVRQHEIRHAPGPITRGKPPVEGMMPGHKYLERPVEYYSDEYIRQMVAAVRRARGRR